VIIVTEIKVIVGVSITKMDAILQDIRNIEFSWIDYNKESEDYFEIIEGRIPVLLSAPHGATHYRKGRFKEEDEYTASLAIKLGEITGAHVIFVKNRTREDPNYDLRARYKDDIRKVAAEKGIRFVADLHGANHTRNYKVNVGIIDEDIIKCSCPTLKPVIEDAFKGFQQPLFNLDCYTASSGGTVTYFARNTCQIEAAQFEINGKYRIIERKPDSSWSQKGIARNFRAKEKDVLEMIRRLERMILKIVNRIS
jgi:hypothetical protein